MVVQIFYFHPYLGKGSNLTNKYVSDWKKQPPRLVFFVLGNKHDTLQDLDIMTHDSCRDSLVALLSTREQSHIPIPNLAQLRYVVVRSLEFFFLLGPILPKARNSTHEKMKLPKGKLYSNHRFLGEQREKIT